MKRLLSVLLSILLAFSMMSLIACGNSNGGGGNSSAKCANCTRFEDKIVYKQNENEMQVYVGKPCKKCGYVSNPERIINVDYVVSKSNDVTTAQEDAETKEMDCVILVKANEYEKIYATARYNGATHIIFETGSKINHIDISPYVYDLTIENANFELEPSNLVRGGIHFEGGAVSADTELSYSNITIKNCNFYGWAQIERAIKYGIVYDLTIEGCKFTNCVHQDAWPAHIPPIFLPEVDGLTIKNNSFKSVDGAIYVGVKGDGKPCRGVAGEVIVENNYFEDVQRSGVGDACISILNINATSNVKIKDNTFNDSDTNGVRVGALVSRDKYTVEILENNWVNIPSSINNATYYNPGDQEYI